jgi:hypothetical protein
LEKRCHRKGQSRPVFLYVLVLEGSEEIVFSVGLRKTILFELLMFGHTKFKGKFRKSENENLVLPRDPLFEQQDSVVIYISYPATGVTYVDIDKM